MKQIDYCNLTHPTLGSCELVINNDVEFRRGGPSIGSKRQYLMEKANGTYICFLDDDEDVSPDYVETLLRLCYGQNDVCSFRSISKLSNNWVIIDMALKNSNEQINPDRITKRTPWHICPVKLDIAKNFTIPNINYGEDFQWFEQVLTKCKTESHTEKVIHEYRHGSHSEADKIK